MDTKQIEYIIAIEQEKSITKAAEKLFITQSALNQQLQKLENELGTELFIRTRSNWHPTEAGEVYLQTAKEILSLKKNAYSKIQDMTDSAKRHFTIGLIPERGVNMFTSIYPKFHQIFPDVIIEPVECNVRTMQMLIRRGELNLGLATLTENQKDNNIYHHMADEELFLAIPASHPLAAEGEKTPHLAKEIDLSLFCEEPFIQIFHRSTMYQLVHHTFLEAGFEPKLLFSTSSNISIRRMVAANVGCALLPQTFATPNENIRYFQLKNHPTWEITICTRKGAYISKAEQAFLDLCGKYWRQELS